MTFISHIVCAYLFVLLAQQVYSVPTVDGSEDLLDALLKRIETLEASDAENKANIAKMEEEFKMKQSESEKEISMLKQRMKKMESDFKLQEEMLLKKIKDQTLMSLDSISDITENESVGDDIVDQAPSVKDHIQQRRSIIRKDRSIPEMETAFYATHTVHATHHLGVNQVLPFELAITNVGNAYNIHTSTFVAPVPGTYVFHATVMGIDEQGGDPHMRAYFDVDGTAYSVFYVTSYDQSSQMLVINLTAGQTVSVKNDYSDEGFIGTHHSSFSGFLLYQHSSMNAVVGK
ncbi:hypothetical protein ACF0H5_019012 [Mactra antiquata]